MKRKWVLLSIVLMVILLYAPGCNRLENLTNSGSKLICAGITGTDLDGNPDSTTIFSDVLRNGSVVNDNAKATLTAVLLDPDNTASTFYQDIIVDQVDITYTRSDGLNQPGKDVPYGFSQRVYMRVGIGDTIDLPFVLVQHTAKLESPLVELINLGQEKILKVEAQVTIYGKDVAGNRVEPAVGIVSVWFSNFTDPEQ